VRDSEQHAERADEVHVSMGYGVKTSSKNQVN
jgi:hypothetical protein